MTYKGIFRSRVELLLETPCIVDAADANVTYHGFQSQQALTSEAKWAILKIEIDGDITTYKWSNGSRREDQIWDNRANLTYNYKTF